MIQSLQSLRGIFAFIIFLSHCYSHYTGENLARLDGASDCGVSFFMILSGFVLSKAYGQRIFNSQFHTGKFLLHRIIRVYPLHIICLGAALFIIYRHVSGSFAWVVPNVLLLQSWSTVHSVYFSGNAVSWFLSDLMVFYVLFPVLMKTLTPRGYIVLSIIYLSGILIISDEYIDLIYINPIFRIFDFICGMGIWKIWKVYGNRFDGFRYKMALLYLGLILLPSALYLYPEITPRFALASYWWIPVGCIVLGATACNNSHKVLMRLLENKWLVKFGDMSFSFYMTHALCLVFLVQLMDKFEIHPPLIPAMTGIFIFSVVVSWTLYCYFEKPVTKRLMKFLTKD